LLGMLASWCHPCRADIPHLKEVYDLYHPYGFEIVSVSLATNATTDQGHRPGEDAMAAVVDMEAFNRPLPKSYHINGSRIACCSTPRVSWSR